MRKKSREKLEQNKNVLVNSKLIEFILTPRHQTHEGCTNVQILILKTSFIKVFIVHKNINTQLKK